MLQNIKLYHVFHLLETELRRICRILYSSSILTVTIFHSPRFLTKEISDEYIHVANKDNIMSGHSLVMIVAREKVTRKAYSPNLTDRQGGQFSRNISK